MNVGSALRTGRIATELDEQERIGFDLSRLREADWRGLAIRFGFGFAVSVLVGVVALLAGDRVAGLFLAFPAILPASLTLIAEKDGECDARVDASGAIVGAVALAAFGAVSYVALAHWPSGIAELAALAAWTIVAVGLYLARRRWFAA